jgi:hypothetical protein
MKVLRRFPRLAHALRDGRLCLSTLSLLGPVLTEENADEILSRAAYRTAADVDHLVASLQPRPTPREGIRKLPELAGAAPAPPPVSPSEAANVGPVSAPPLVIKAPRPRTLEVRALSEGRWSLRVTVDRACRDDLETLSMLLSHKVPRGDLGAVLHEAIRCGIEKHGKRKGAVKPARKVAPKAVAGKAAIPTEVRRQVWERDKGRCAWTGPDGRRCGSRWQIEVDHVLPPSRGGTSMVGNLRLACRQHNLLHAEQVYGREHMRKYRKGKFAIDVDSGPPVPVVRELHSTG